MTSTRRFSRGQWIRRISDGRIGWVVDISMRNSYTYLVHFLESKYPVSEKETNLESYESTHPDVLDAMIDFSLDISSKKMFDYYWDKKFGEEKDND